MAIPTDLSAEIAEACNAAGLDPDDAAGAIARLVGDDAYIDHSVWQGPAYENEGLDIDIFVVGHRGLYSYTVWGDGAQSEAGHFFLDSISVVSLLRVSHERSPYVLAFESGGTTGMIYGQAADHEKLEQFRRNLATACLSSRKLKGHD